MKNSRFIFFQTSLDISTHLLKIQNRNRDESLNTIIKCSNLKGPQFSCDQIYYLRKFHQGSQQDYREIHSLEFWISLEISYPFPIVAIRKLRFVQSFRSTSSQSKYLLFKVVRKFRGFVQNGEKPYVGLNCTGIFCSFKFISWKYFILTTF